ncbi:MAG: hypothetical protein QXN53_07960 [Thermoproteota archaeon]
MIKSLKFEEIARHHIFPRKILAERYNIPKEASDEDYPLKGVNGLGNITLVCTEVNSEVSDEEPAKYLTKYRSEDLEKHFVPTDRTIWYLQGSMTLSKKG